MNQRINALKQEEYNTSFSHTLETRNQVRSTSTMTSPVQSKYKIELEFLGTVDNAQVEEEIIAILKRQFLSKITSIDSLPQALQSNPIKGGTKE